MTDDQYSWRKDYVAVVIPYLKANNVFQGGELCLWARQEGLREPHHHNEWVSMPNILKSNGLIEAIGVCNPKTSHSHINELTLWKSLAFNPADAKQKDLFND